MNSVSKNTAPISLSEITVTKTTPISLSEIGVAGGVVLLFIVFVVVIVCISINISFIAIIDVIECNHYC